MDKKTAIKDYIKQELKGNFGLGEAYDKANLEKTLDKLVILVTSL